MARITRLDLRRFAAIFLVWMVVGLFMCTQDLTRKFFFHDPTPWWHFLVSWLVGCSISALMTPAILWLGNRFSIGRRNWVRRIALHLLFSVTFSISQLVVDSAILSRLGIFPTFMTTFSGTLVVLLILGFHGNILAYWIVLGIQYTFRYYRRYQEREKEALRLELHASALKSQLMQAQLSALKMQLQPHFLFNTLNAIMVLVRQERGPQAEKTLALLSDLLRCVLEDVEAQEVPLRRELEYLEIYLAIEQVRFQDRLRVEISAEPSALDAAVPHMGLQPIVENAVRHGIGRSSKAGRIEISAAQVNGNLELRVKDDGPGLSATDSPARGIGLANTRERLRQLYGDGASLAVENGDQGGAVVTMILPYHVAVEAADTEVMAVHAADDADRR